ncbi:MAG: hypothetical protein ACW98I_08440 [Candidatus Hodarchaeales archaeon]|jgi:protein-arginine kinase activator protein McsA
MRATLNEYKYIAKKLKHIYCQVDSLFELFEGKIPKKYGANHLSKIQHQILELESLLEDRMLKDCPNIRYEKGLTIFFGLDCDNVDDF